LVVDKKAFAKISPADQAIVRDVMGKVFAGLDKQNRADNISAYNVVLKQGIKPVKPSAAEMVEWEKMGALASSEIVKAGIVSKAAADQVDSALAAFRAGKK
jgi:TRAP-type C4-dicarboxylate transport system substrate-binding protein